jgi:antitoxin PrlF
MPPNQPVPDEATDPALLAFLDLLEADIVAHPERLVPLSAALLDEIEALVGDAEIDLDELLAEDDE